MILYFYVLKAAFTLAVYSKTEHSLLSAPQNWTRGDRLEVMRVWLHWNCAAIPVNANTTNLHILTKMCVFADEDIINYCEWQGNWDTKEVRCNNVNDSIKIINPYAFVKMWEEMHGASIESGESETRPTLQGAIWFRRLLEKNTILPLTELKSCKVECKNYIWMNILKLMLIRNQISLIALAVLYFTKTHQHLNPLLLIMMWTTLTQIPSTQTYALYCIFKTYFPSSFFFLMYQFCCWSKSCWV